MKAKLVFTPLFFSFNSFVNSLANGKDSSANDLDVVFTTAENTGKSSRVIFRFKVTWHSLFLTISKIFSIDFRSGLSSNNLIPGRSGFHSVLSKISSLQEKFPPYDSTFFWTCWKNCSRKNEETFSAFILRWYCSTKTKFFEWYSCLKFKFWGRH